MGRELPTWVTETLNVEKIREIYKMKNRQLSNYYNEIIEIIEVDTEIGIYVDEYMQAILFTVRKECLYRGIRIV